MMAQSLDDLHQLLMEIRDSRRSLVQSIVDSESANSTRMQQSALALCTELQKAHELLIQGQDTQSDYRHFTTEDSSLVLNLRDELFGLRKDMAFVQLLRIHGTDYLAHYTHMLSAVHNDDDSCTDAAGGQRHIESESDTLCSFLGSLPVRPVMVTDWDGTMKTYSSQYVTCMQPAADAAVMCLFASQCTHRSAVLTAGPLRAPGILDLTAAPSMGYLLFGGSWGREWWLDSGRVVHEENMAAKGKQALADLADKISELLTTQPAINGTCTPRFHQFSMVGSGFQRKVDRISLGVQSVCGQVSAERMKSYIAVIRQLVNTVDPNGDHLTFHEDERDLEVCVKQSSDCEQTIWTKGTGMQFLERVTPIDLSERAVLICGDTLSDVSMVEYALIRNANGTYAVFVNANEELKIRLRAILAEEKLCFVSSPSVVHAAMAKQLAKGKDSAKVNGNGVVK